jgi:membrane protease subunit HflC
MRLLFKIILILLVLLVVRLSVYTVDAAEYAYVTLLGKPLETYDGGDGEGGAGLHVGWPWPIQSVQRLDRRLQHFDLPATEILTTDQDGRTIDKTLSIEAYVCWRIADRGAVDLFVRRLGTPDKARSILGPRVASALGATLTQMAMDDLVSTAPGKDAGKTRVDEKMEQLRTRLLDSLRGPLRSDYGVDLVDIRLRRFSHPPSVREFIFRRIRSERMRQAALYESDGELQAANIQSKAETEVRELLAKARAEEEKKKGEADAIAMKILNQAHSQDPEFYTFLKSMKSLQSILGEKTVLLLSTHRPLFDLLFRPPSPRANEPAPPAKKNEPASTGGQP